MNDCMSDMIDGGSIGPISSKSKKELSESLASVHREAEL